MKLFKFLLLTLFLIYPLSIFAQEGPATKEEQKPEATKETKETPAYVTPEGELGTKEGAIKPREQEPTKRPIPPKEEEKRPEAEKKEEKRPVPPAAPNEDIVRPIKRQPDSKQPVYDPNVKRPVQTQPSGVVEEEAPSKGLTLKQWGLIAMGLGCVSIGAGVALNMYAINEANNANNIDPTISGEVDYARDKYNKAQTFANIAYGLYGVGVTALGAGVVLIVLDSETDYVYVTPLHNGFALTSTWKF